MSFADDLASSTPTRRVRKPCILGQFVDGWEDQSSFDDALEEVSRGYRSLQQVHQLLTPHFDHSYSTLWKHFHGHCGCPSDG